MNGETTIVPDSGEDTIELQLTPEQIRYLAQTEAIPDPDTPTRPSILAEIAKSTAAIVAYGAFAWWGASHLDKPPDESAAAAVHPAAVSPRPIAIQVSTAAAVRVMNPFDATEVFEFPAGTSPAETHEKVAQILMQRARERRVRWERAEATPGLRTASLYPAR